VLFNWDFPVEHEINNNNNNNIKAKELPKWEQRLNKRINNIRRDLGRITQYLKGINSNHLNTIINSLNIIASFQIAVLLRPLEGLVVCA
jgi:hypothetical protein